MKTIDLPDLVLDQKLCYSKLINFSIGIDIFRLFFFLLQRVQKNLAVMNKNMRSGCSCMSMLLSMLGIVGLAVVIWLLVKYL